MSQAAKAKVVARGDVKLSQPVTVPSRSMIFILAEVNRKLTDNTPMVVEPATRVTGAESGDVKTKSKQAGAMDDVELVQKIKEQVEKQLARKDLTNEQRTQYTALLVKYRQMWNTAKWPQPAKLPPVSIRTTGGP